MFTRIHLEYVFFVKKIKLKQVEHAINLSHERYCSVISMIKGSVPITSSYKIIDKNLK